MNIISKYIGSTALAMALCPCLTVYAQSDSIVNVAFGTLPKEDVINAVSSVNMEELLKKNFTDNALDGSLQSIIGGYNGQVWGQDALVLVDGMPRDVATCLPRKWPRCRCSRMPPRWHFMAAVPPRE